MSWGERSCLSPCRMPDNCKMETCNVDCPGYAWDGSEPDSKPKKHLENKLRATKAGTMLNHIGVDIAEALPKDDTDEKLKGIDIESEYKLIQEKKSGLSASLRNLVIWKHDQISR